jgi:hypothetical protein
MATVKKPTESIDETSKILQERQVKALEKIANSLDALTIWFEEIDKDTWGQRIEWYLHEWFTTTIEPKIKDKE